MDPKDLDLEILLQCSVMKSCVNSFCRYVFLDSVNMAYRHKNSVLDLIYEKQIFLDRYYEDFKF